LKQTQWSDSIKISTIECGNYTLLRDDRSCKAAQTQWVKKTVEEVTFSIITSSFAVQAASLSSLYMRNAQRVKESIIITVAAVSKKPFYNALQTNWCKAERRKSGFADNYFAFLMARQAWLCPNWFVQAAAAAAAAAGEQRADIFTTLFLRFHYQFIMRSATFSFLLFVCRKLFKMSAAFSFLPGCHRSLPFSLSLSLSFQFCVCRTTKENKGSRTKKASSAAH
jgi:hypothetical protein